MTPRGWSKSSRLFAQSLHDTIYEEELQKYGQIYGPSIRKVFEMSQRELDEQQAHEKVVKGVGPEKVSGSHKSHDEDDLVENQQGLAMSRPLFRGDSPSSIVIKDEPGSPGEGRADAEGDKCSEDLLASPKKKRKTTKDGGKETCGSPTKAKQSADIISLVSDSSTDTDALSPTLSAARRQEKGKSKVKEEIVDESLEEEFDSLNVDLPDTQQMLDGADLSELEEGEISERPAIKVAASKVFPATPTRQAKAELRTTTGSSSKRVLPPSFGSTTPTRKAVTPPGFELVLPGNVYNTQKVVGYVVSLYVGQLKHGLAHSLPANILLQPAEARARVSRKFIEHLGATFPEVKVNSLIKEDSMRTLVLSSDGNSGACLYNMPTSCDVGRTPGDPGTVVARNYVDIVMDMEFNYRCVANINAGGKVGIRINKQCERIDVATLGNGGVPRNAKVVHVTKAAIESFNKYEHASRMDVMYVPVKYLVVRK